MKIFIASDHRGFQLKNLLIAWLKEKNYDVVDCGPEKYNLQDDYVDYANKVINHVIPNLFRDPIKILNQVQNDKGVFGILICGSGIGMSIAANRHKGIRAGLGFSVEQVSHGRQNDNINVLVLDSDNIDIEINKKIVNVFLTTRAKTDEKYLRRQKKLDEII